MTKIYKSNEVIHSLTWLAMYLFISTVAGNIAGRIDAEYYAVSSIPVFLLGLICLVYLLKTGISKEIGLLCKSTEKAKHMLFYIPLLILPAFSLLGGFDTHISALEYIAAFFMHVGVGLIEEIVFRGLMFKALTKEWNRIAVVAFISVTFGMGHVMSMAVVGMSGSDALLQIINAFVVGFMFMTVMLASKNLTICVIAHVIYNFLATVCLPNDFSDIRIGFNAVVTIAYFIYLFVRRGNIKGYFKQTSLDQKGSV